MISDDAPAFDEGSGKTMTYKVISSVNQDKFDTKVSWEYFVRVFYRILDVLYRLSILVLIWIILGGLALFCVVLMEFLILTKASYNYKELSMLLLFSLFFFVFTAGVVPVLVCCFFYFVCRVVLVVFLCLLLFMCLNFNCAVTAF